ncbi:microtubule-associated protein 4 [Rhinophrynus dorsalis]
MADLEPNFSLEDALTDAVPNIEPVVKRDFISSLEAEPFDDVVGETCDKTDYVPLLDDDETKEQKNRPALEGSQSERSQPSVLENGEHNMGENDITGAVPGGCILDFTDSTAFPERLEALNQEERTHRAFDEGWLTDSNSKTEETDTPSGDLSERTATLGETPSEDSVRLPLQVPSDPFMEIWQPSAEEQIALSSRHPGEPFRIDEEALFNLPEGPTSALCDIAAMTGDSKSTDSPHTEELEAVLGEQQFASGEPCLESLGQHRDQSNVGQSADHMASPEYLSVDTHNVDLVEKLEEAQSAEELARDHLVEPKEYSPSKQGTALVGQLDAAEDSNANKSIVAEDRRLDTSTSGVEVIQTETLKQPEGIQSVQPGLVFEERNEDVSEIQSEQQILNQPAVPCEDIQSKEPVMFESGSYQPTIPCDNKFQQPVYVDEHRAPPCDEIQPEQAVHVDEHRALPCDEIQPEQAVHVEEHRTLPCEEIQHEQPVHVDEHRALPCEEIQPEQPVHVDEHRALPCDEIQPEQPVHVDEHRALPCDEIQPEQPVHVDEHRALPCDEIQPEQPVHVDEHRALPCDEIQPEQAVHVEEHRTLPCEAIQPEQAVHVEEHRTLPCEAIQPQQAVCVEDQREDQPAFTCEEIQPEHPVHVEDHRADQPVFPCEGMQSVQPIDVECHRADRPAFPCEGIQAPQPGHVEDYSVDQPAPTCDEIQSGHPVDSEGHREEQPSLPCEGIQSEQPVQVTERRPEEPSPLTEPSPKKGEDAPCVIPLLKSPQDVQATINQVVKTSEHRFDRTRSAVVPVSDVFAEGHVVRENRNVPLAESEYGEVLASRAKALHKKAHEMMELRKEAGKEGVNPESAQAMIKKKKKKPKQKRNAPPKASEVFFGEDLNANEQTESKCVPAGLETETLAQQKNLKKHANKGGPQKQEPLITADNLTCSITTKEDAKTDIPQVVEKGKDTKEGDMVPQSKLKPKTGPQTIPEKGVDYSPLLQLEMLPTVEMSLEKRHFDKQATVAKEVRKPETLVETKIEFTDTGLIECPYLKQENLEKKLASAKNTEIDDAKNHSTEVPLLLENVDATKTKVKECFPSVEAGAEKSVPTTAAMKREKPKKREKISGDHSLSASLSGVRTEKELSREIAITETILESETVPLEKPFNHRDKHVKHEKSPPVSDKLCGKDLPENTNSELESTLSNPLMINKADTVVNKPKSPSTEFPLLLENLNGTKTKGKNYFPSLEIEAEKPVLTSTPVKREKPKKREKRLGEHSFSVPLSVLKPEHSEAEEHVITDRISESENAILEKSRASEEKSFIREKPLVSEKLDAKDFKDDTNKDLKSLFPKTLVINKTNTEETTVKSPIELPLLSENLEETKTVKEEFPSLQGEKTLPRTASVKRDKLKNREKRLGERSLYGPLSGLNMEPSNPEKAHSRETAIAECILEPKSIIAEEPFNPEMKTYKTENFASLFDKLDFKDIPEDKQEAPFAPADPKHVIKKKQENKNHGVPPQSGLYQDQAQKCATIDHPFCFKLADEVSDKAVPVPSIPVVKTSPFRNEMHDDIIPLGDAVGINSGRIQHCDSTEKREKPKKERERRKKSPVSKSLQTVLEKSLELGTPKTQLKTLETDKTTGETLESKDGTLTKQSVNFEKDFPFEQQCPVMSEASLADEGFSFDHPVKNKSGKAKLMPSSEVEIKAGDLAGREAQTVTIPGKTESGMTYKAKESSFSVGKKSERGSLKRPHGSEGKKSELVAETREVHGKEKGRILKDNAVDSHKDSVVLPPAGLMAATGQVRKGKETQEQGAQELTNLQFFPLDFVKDQKVDEINKIEKPKSDLLTQLADDIVILTAGSDKPADKVTPSKACESLNDNVYQVEQLAPHVKTEAKDKVKLGTENEDTQERIQTAAHPADVPIVDLLDEKEKQTVLLKEMEVNIFGGESENKNMSKMASCGTKEHYDASLTGATSSTLDTLDTKTVQSDLQATNLEESLDDSVKMLQLSTEAPHLILESTADIPQVSIPSVVQKENLGCEDNISAESLKSVEQLLHGEEPVELHTEEPAVPQSRSLVVKLDEELNPSSVLADNITLPEKTPPLKCTDLGETKKEASKMKTNNIQIKTTQPRTGRVQQKIPIKPEEKKRASESLKGYMRPTKSRGMTPPNLRPSAPESEKPRQLKDIRLSQHRQDKEKLEAAEIIEVGAKNDITPSQSKELSQSPENDITPSQSKELPPSPENDITVPPSKELPPSPENDITAPPSKELPPSPEKKTKASAATPSKSSAAKTRPIAAPSPKKPASSTPTQSKKPASPGPVPSSTSTPKRPLGSAGKVTSATPKDSKDTKPKSLDLKSPVKSPDKKPATPKPTPTSTPRSSVKASPAATKANTSLTSAPPAPKSTVTPKRPAATRNDVKPLEAKKVTSIKSPTELSRPKSVQADLTKGTGAAPPSPGTAAPRPKTAKPPVPKTTSASATDTKKLPATKSTPLSKASTAPVTKTTSAPISKPSSAPKVPSAAGVPDLKNVRSKIGSTDNLKHQPGGGKAKVEKRPVPASTARKPVPPAVTKSAANKSTDTKETAPKQTNGKVQIVSKKVNYSHVQSKCGSKDNIKHVPGGGNVTNAAKPAAGSARLPSSSTNKPGSANVQILNKKVDVSKVSSKCGSKANIKHKPGGGAAKPESNTENSKKQEPAKVTPLDNMKEEESATGTEQVNLPQNGDLATPTDISEGTQENGVGETIPEQGDNQRESFNALIKETSI